MNKVLKSILCILKNATVIIPLIEGVVYSVRDLVNHKPVECQNEESNEEPTSTSSAC